ncbi:ATP-binding protein [Sulfuricurvum sp.]|uniref:sensor histidine kinase n=1 Tax=Sulfuricurvum sp. TaxID=2025608 RepID=UPI0026342EF9|nr:ATP-binding protein [Sulfuricurvum sp.]MDD2780306.1 ATP-binding protein [Sulfuricurvum sp.]
MIFLRPYRHYFLPFFIQVFITLIGTRFTESIGLINIAILHLIPVLVIALRGDMVATMIITTISVILFDLLYIPPKYSFNVHNLIYAWSFILFYVVGYIITFQSRRLHSTAIKDVLLSTLSHDLKTPLSSIIGNISLLHKREKLNESDHNRIVVQIKQSSQQMNRLILNLLDSARLQNTQTLLQPQWCDWEDLVGIALQEFDQDHQLIASSIDPELPLFWGDTALLVRLLVNLLDNGIKYSNDDTLISLTIQSLNDSIQISVFNQSPPIKKADLKNMFEKFYRLENTADMGGSGIGLSICKKIVTAHQGVITAYNGNGGVFLEVILPTIKHPDIRPKELL